MCRRFVGFQVLSFHKPLVLRNMEDKKVHAKENNRRRRCQGRGLFLPAAVCLRAVYDPRTGQQIL
jgi:hypothetical protein